MIGRFGLAAILCLLAACQPTTNDLDQLSRVLGESSAARATESIGCWSRDRVCAQIVQMQAEAAAELADDTQIPQAQRSQFMATSLQDARKLPQLLPADAPYDEQTASEYAVFRSWVVAMDNAAAAPADLTSAAATLQEMPTGAPYAATFSSLARVHQVLTGQVAPTADCATLATAERLLPEVTDPPLGPEINLARADIDSSKEVKGCSSSAN